MAGSSASSSTASSTTTSTESVTTPSAPATTAPIVPPNPAIVVRRGNADRRWIALTFDAGSDAGNATTILDLLAARHLHASFAITGTWARAHPDLVARIARDGHVIVNHTDTHRSFTGYSTHTAALGRDARWAQLDGADVAITAITGHTTRPWFRPPYGDIDDATAADVGDHGYGYVLLWTVDSLGWKGTSPDAVVSRCLEGAVPGAILLFHVGSASTDASALPRVLDGLVGRGYDLVTVAEPGFVSG